jgi:acetyl-CoA acetyltransferase
MSLLAKVGTMIQRDKYAIAGVAQTRIGKVPEMSDYGLQVEAAKRAVDDAGLKMSDIDGMITHSHLLGGVRVHHQRVAQRLGLDTTFGVSVSSGGATSCLMVQLAAAAIEAGFCKAVLCVHGDKSLTRAGNTHDGEHEFGPE